MAHRVHVGYRPISFCKLLRDLSASSDSAIQLRSLKQAREQLLIAIENDVSSAEATAVTIPLTTTSTSSDAETMSTAATTTSGDANTTGITRL